MIKLKSIDIQGFRRFKVQVTVEFPSSGLLLLDGDSGSGKSTVLQAIAYALDICPFPATTLRSWTGETMQVNLTLDADGKAVRVCRGKYNAIEHEGEQPKTGAKALEEGLRALFGLTPELLSALTYRPQDTLGLFLSKDDAEKKEFLGHVLGLNSVEAAIEDSDARRKKLQSDFTYAEGALVEREAGLRKILEHQTEISPDPHDTGFESRVAACKETYATVEKLVDAAKAEQDRAYTVFQTESSIERHAKTERLDYAKLLYKGLKDKSAKTNQELDSKREELQGQITRLSTELNGFGGFRKAKAQAESQLESLRRNECYVCHKPFTAELEIDSLQEEIDNLNNKLATEPALRARWTDLSASLRALIPVVDQNEAKLAKVVSDLEAEIKWIGKNITDTRVITAQKRYDSELQKLASVKGDLLDAESALREYRSSVDAKNRLRARQEIARNEAVKSVDDKRTELAGIEAELNAEKDFLHVLGRDGFLGAIFDDVLGEISQKATETLGSIPNTSHISVAFKTENNKGKRTISPVFFVDGYETTRKSGLSGGMGASADLAVDLGVAAVVERRLGTAPGWFCLDETFNGMPRATKEAALEALQNFVAGSDKLVIVVDHGTELKSSFTKMLTVKSEGDRSFV